MVSQVSQVVGLAVTSQVSNVAGNDVDLRRYSTARSVFRGEIERSERGWVFLSREKKRRVSCSRKGHANQPTAASGDRYVCECDHRSRRFRRFRRHLRSCLVWSRRSRNAAVSQVSQIAQAMPQVSLPPRIAGPACEREARRLASALARLRAVFCREYCRPG